MQPTTLLSLAGIGALFAYARDWLWKVWLYASAFVIRREYVLINFYHYHRILRELNGKFPPLSRPVNYYVLHSQDDVYTRLNLSTEEHVQRQVYDANLQPVLLRVRSSTSFELTTFAKEATEAAASLFGLFELRFAGLKPFWLRHIDVTAKHPFVDGGSGAVTAKLEITSFRFYDASLNVKAALHIALLNLERLNLEEGYRLQQQRGELPFGRHRGQRFELITVCGSDRAGFGNDESNRVFKEPTAGRSQPPGTYDPVANFTWLTFENDCEVVTGELFMQTYDDDDDSDDDETMTLWLPPELKALWDDVEQWLLAYADYKEIGLPHRYGFGLYGLPGTGKTSFVIALAQRHQIPVYSLQLANMGESDIQDLKANLPRFGAAIILMEDIDTVFHGNARREDARTNSFKNLIGLDAIRQLMDNNTIPCSVICVFTTNHLDKVDETLYRAGRCDRVVEVLPLPPEGIAAVVEKRLRRHPELVNAAVASALKKREEVGHITAAETEQICLQEILKHKKLNFRVLKKGEENFSSD